MIRDEILGWFTLALLVVAPVIAVIGVRGWLRWRTTDGLYCPGPSPPWYCRLNPARWCVRRACWYNLTGLADADGGAVRCPECGSVVLPTRRVRDPRRWRPAVCAVALLLLGAGLFAVPWIQAGDWARAVPTPILILFEGGRRSWQPRAFRREIERRFSAASPPKRLAPWLATRLIEDLSSDDVRWNADRACGLFTTVWPASRAPLEGALASGDRQVRLLAAELLREQCLGDPSDALLAACVEDLGEDDPDVTWYLGLGNARRAGAYLCRFPRHVEPFLAAGMASTDPQRRLLSAAAAGQCGLHRLLPQAAPILIMHLRDDDVAGNARIAAPALYRFGPGVLPFLEAYLATDDVQMRGIALAITERLLHPDRTIHDVVNPLPELTATSRDPLIESDIWEATRALRGLSLSD